MQMLAARHRLPDPDSGTANKHRLGAHSATALRMSERYTSIFSPEPEWQRNSQDPSKAAVDGIVPYGCDHHGLSLRRLGSVIEGKYAKTEIPLKEEELGTNSQIFHIPSGSTKPSSTMTDVPIPQNGILGYTAGTRATGSDGAPSMNPNAPWSNDGGASERGRHEASQKDDEDIYLDDGGDECDDDIGRPQTAAERIAARRKMKRFRLTHQQTRFLMSEFVKQPHPDAAHRDRLSREIPGLSPRQVQVWFQNRRAKIKRMNAEDRDRVIKMRAVPESFDNIQALHSPYGAVHGLGPNMSSPTEMGHRPFGEQMGRASMVDLRGGDTDNNIPMVGISAGFDAAGFPPTTLGGGPELVSPRSSNSNDRPELYGSHVTPVSDLGLRNTPTSLTGTQQGGLDHALPHGRRVMRPLQPLQVRDSHTRPRSDSVQSALRGGTTWKYDAMDYPTYPVAQHATSPMVDRHVPFYQVESAPITHAEYGTDAYIGPSTQSNVGLAYPPFQQDGTDRPRLRSSSATFPLNMDTRNQYGAGLQKNQSPSYALEKRSPTASTQYARPSIYTTSYPPAPLTAPISIAQPGGNTLPRADMARNPELQGNVESSASGTFLGGAHAHNMGPPREPPQATTGATYKSQQHSDTFDSDLGVSSSLPHKLSPLTPKKTEEPKNI